MTAEPHLTPLTRTAPLVTWGDALAASPDGVQVIPRPFVAIADLRVDPTGPAGAAVAAYLGVVLPTTPSTYVESESATAIWLGPDEWLITSPFLSPEGLETGLREAILLEGEVDDTGFTGSVVDVSAQRTTLRLRGEHARDLLAGGCSVDLHPRVFARGTAVQTLLGQAAVVMMALDDTGTHYQLVVRSSFAGYVIAWLLDAATEYRTAG